MNYDDKLLKTYILYVRNIQLVLQLTLFPVSVLSPERKHAAPQSPATCVMQIFVQEIGLKANIPKQERTRPLRCNINTQSFYYFNVSRLFPFTLFCIILYSLHCTFTHYPLPFTLYPLPFTHYPLPFTLYTLPFTLYPLPFTLYPLHFVLYTIHYTLYILHFTLYTLLFTLCT